MNIPAKRILITGISGFLGHHVAGKNRPDLELFGTYHTQKVDFVGISCVPLDIMDINAFTALLEEIKPDAVLHLAAMSNPNDCEKKLEECEEINTTAPFHLAGACHIRGITFVFASTDLVFDGKKAPYESIDAANPVMVYGATKAKSETLLNLMYPQDILIVRLPLMYGWCKDANNFMTHWIEELQAGKNIGAFTDEYRTAAWASDVVDGLFLLIEKEARGFYHLGGPKSESRYDFAITMAEVFNLPADLINPILQKDIKMAAKRPKDVSLISREAQKMGYEPKDAKTALLAIKAELKK